MCRCYGNSGSVINNMSTGETCRAEKQKQEAERNDVHLQKGEFLQWSLDPPPHKRITKLLPKKGEELEDELMRLIGLTDHRTNMKDSALLELYVKAFCWAKEEDYSATQISFTMGLIQMLLDNIKVKKMGLIENTTEFASALAASQIEAEDGILDGEDAKELLTFVKDNFFQKYSLFEVMLTMTSEEIQYNDETTVDVFNCPRTLTPLEEGIPANIYKELLDESETGSEMDEAEGEGGSESDSESQ